MQKKVKILLALISGLVTIFGSISVLGAGVELQGKIESAYWFPFAKDGNDSMENYLQWELRLPWTEKVTGQVVGKLPDRGANQVDRLYIRYFQPKYDLTLGKQPLTWGAGLFFNPADPFAPTIDPTTGEMDLAPGYSGVNVNLPLGALSQASLFRVLERNKPVTGAVYRTNLQGTDVITALVSGQDQVETQLSLQLQGNATKVGWFGQGALQTLAQDKTRLQWVLGADYSWNNRTFVRGELSNTTRTEDLATGISVRYLPDDISSYSCTFLIIPGNDFWQLTPVYRTQLTEVLGARAYLNLASNSQTTGVGLGLTYIF